MYMIKLLSDPFSVNSWDSVGSNDILKIGLVLITF